MLKVHLEIKIVCKEEQATSPFLTRTNIDVTETGNLTEQQVSALKESIEEAVQNAAIISEWGRLVTVVNAGLVSPVETPAKIQTQLDNLRRAIEDADDEGLLPT